MENFYICGCINGLITIPWGILTHTQSLCPTILCSEGLHWHFPLQACSPCWPTLMRWHLVCRLMYALGTLWWVRSRGWILKSTAYRGKLCLSTRVGEVTRSRAEGESKGTGVCLGANTFELPVEMRVSKRHSRRDGNWAGKTWSPNAKKKRVSRWERPQGWILVFCFCLLNITQILKIINSMLWGEFYS